MKVLSLLQPHASLVTLNAKRIETRSWNTTHRGQLLIHSSKGKPKHARDLITTDPFSHMFPAQKVNELPFRPFDVLPFGFIIGTVDLIHVVSTDLIVQEYGRKRDAGVIHYGGHCWQLTKREIAFGDYSAGRYAWLFANIVQFKKPVPAKGALSLWNFDASLLNQPA